jgi:hypothetical protein
MSMIKRRQGSHVHGRTYHSQCRDLRLMALTHNLLILIFIELFYRADVRRYFASRAELCSALGEVEKCQEGIFQQAVSRRQAVPWLLGSFGGARRGNPL